MAAKIPLQILNQAYTNAIPYSGVWDNFNGSLSFVWELYYGIIKAPGGVAAATQEYHLVKEELVGSSSWGTSMQGRRKPQIP